MRQWNQPYNEIEAVYFSEIREKKKAASGVHSKTGKNGYTGKILFPSDFMSRKEKYNHRKAGKVMTTNLYEKIIAKDEFYNLETHEQRNRLAYWRTQFDNTTIQKAMGLNNSKYYDLVKELGLNAARTPRNKDQSIAAKAKRISKAIQAKKEIETAPEVPKAPAADHLASQNIIVTAAQEIMVNGLHFVFNGTYSSEHIQKQLLKYATILDDEPDQFYVELKIVQKPKNK